MQMSENGHYNIRSAAVVGSGTMGSGIAALLAGVGIPVWLLDIAPKELTPAEAAKGLTLEHRAVKNRIVTDNIAKYKKANPPVLYLDSDLELITPGNLDDDFDKLGQVDWVIEVIVENLEVKRSFFAKLDEVRHPGQIISSNTSGIPIHKLAEGRSDDFRANFLGTHFFNPPRFLKLLEVIPTPETNPVLVEFFRTFGAQRLGKGVVVCKDTPNFIANRIGGANGFRMSYALDNGYTVEETDAIAGPLMGYPKTAVFRLMDLVGLDVAAMVGQNLGKVLPGDAAAGVGENAPRVMQTLLDKGWLGNKSGVGFYKAVAKADGSKEFWSLDVTTMEHVPPTKVRFDSIGAVRRIDDLGERLRAWVRLDDRAAQYVWHTLAFLFSYSAERIPEISDTIYAIDDAMRWGYMMQAGPFESWDMLGVAYAVERMEKDGYAVAPWVKDMLDKGHDRFYHYTTAGRECYNPLTGQYEVVPGTEKAVNVAFLKHNQRELERNNDASLHDMGDGVLLLEFHSKANTITGGTMDMFDTALDYLKHPTWGGLVIGNEGEMFCAGANLDPQALMMAGEPPAVVVEKMTRRLQDALMAVRYADKPVVAAPFDRVLGGGTEIALAAARRVAAMELYIGLVEVGVGLVPAGGGCKELVRRLINPVMRTQNADVLPHLQRVLETIGTAKVSMGAKQAFELGFLGEGDRIVMDRERLLGEAKREALHMAHSGYVAPRLEKVYAAGRDVYNAARVSLWQMEQGGYISAHDRFITDKLAYILTGGDISAPAWLDEQYFLDLERSTFVELIQHPMSMARIMHMLNTGKPLRN